MMVSYSCEGRRELLLQHLLHGAVVNVTRGHPTCVHPPQEATGGFEQLLPKSGYHRVR